MINGGSRLTKLMSSKLITAWLANCKSGREGNTVNQIVATLQCKRSIIKLYNHTCASIMHACMHA
jgi:hypothetical protein